MQKTREELSVTSSHSKVKHIIVTHETDTMQARSAEMLEHLLFATSSAVAKHLFNLYRGRELHIFWPILR